MANQEHIRRQVESVRGEARSLISRYRAERLAKMGRSAEAPKDAPLEVQQSAPAPAPARSVAAEPRASQDDGFAASPIIDRFLADHLKTTLSSQARPAVKTESAASEAPVQAPKSSESSVRSAPAQSFIKAHTGLELGLEPVFVAAAPPPRRATSAPKSYSVPLSGEALGLQPVIQRQVKSAPEQAAVAAPVTPSLPRKDEAPLSSLIAIGPALGLRLAELGIRSVYDLAAADESQVRQRLGSIGALVRVDAWIEEARSFVASQSRAQTG